MCDCDHAIGADDSATSALTRWLRPNQNLARSLQRQILDTNNAIARLPRQYVAPLRVNDTIVMRWVDPAHLAEWRRVRDAWAAWYSRGKFDASTDLILDWGNVIDGWRRFYGLPRWNKQTAEQYQTNVRRAHALGDQPMNSNVIALGAEGQWFAAAGSAEGGTDVRFVWQQRGAEMHAWARIVWPGHPPIFIHAMTDLDAIRREMEAHPQIKRAITAAGAEVGWFGSSMFKKIAKAAKKQGITRVMNQVRGVVAKAMNNPIVQQALMATPYGAAALGIYNGAKMARAAMSGNLKAKNAIQFLSNQTAAGVPGAQKALMFVRQGAAQIQQGQGLAQQLQSGNMDFGSMLQQGSALASQFGGKRGGDLAANIQNAQGLAQTFNAGQVFARSLGDDAASLMQLANLYKAGDDTSDVTPEVEALMTFATAGAFDGMRWLVSRMGLHSMEGRPDELTKRQALMSGRDVLATRFA